MFNDEKLADRINGLFHQVFRGDKVQPGEKTMDGEDFSLYGRAGVPILMFRLGTIEPEKLTRLKQLGETPPSLHSPLYYPEAAESLTTGVQAAVAAVTELLKP